MFIIHSLIPLLLLQSTVSAINPTCPIIHDGRIPSTFTIPTQFDTSSSPFSSSHVKGESLKFSNIIRFPSTSPSRFDLPAGKPIQVSINQKSIFRPGSGPPQLGFRRVGLILAGNNGSDASTTGIKTFHWSTHFAGTNQFNYSHEYINVWHERNDFAGSQFNFQTGTLIGREKKGDASDWKMLDKNDKVVWQMKREKDSWQNFAVTLDYVKKYVDVNGACDVTC
jgi:hypothetical protein